MTRKPMLVLVKGRSSLAIAIAQMLANERWKDGPGGEESNPDRALEERDERDRMENEFERIWEGDV